MKNDKQSKIIILVFLLSILMSGCTETKTIKYCYYKFIDLDGNEGKATLCWENYGNLVCKNARTKTYTQVKKYQIGCKKVNINE